MSQADFLLAVKSTIDKLGSDLASAQVPPVRFVDLDDSTAVEEVLTSTDPAIIWEFSGLEDSPSDPLYTAVFSIGARTTNDAANYSILSLVGKVRAIFPVNEVIEIKNYSDVVASAKQGNMRVTSVSVNPQAYDRTSGLRLITIAARVQRFI